jgi:NAD(P)-dependent dehydrogenase (short-subunit alcohol dehydrogenase family)
MTATDPTLVTTATDTSDRARTAIVTGASRGLGLALATALVARGWQVVGDGRDRRALEAAFEPLGPGAVPVAGDVGRADHRAALVEAAGGPVDLLVNNAGGLGPSPLPALVEVDPAALEDLFATNVVAPLALIQAALPVLAPGATVIDITSDAAVEAYEGWGVYGTTKAALDHLGRVLAVERPELRVLTVDPGDLRTAMHQAAFPGEDISDRPRPEDAAVPGLLALIEGTQPSGRYRAAELAAPAPRGA